MWFEVKFRKLGREVRVGFNNLKGRDLVKHKKREIKIKKFLTKIE